MTDYLSSRGDSIIGTTNTVWANATTAKMCDGAVGSHPGTYTTWTNAVNGATGTITVGYDFSAIPDQSVISDVTATINQLAAATSASKTVTLQLKDSTGTNIGSAQEVSIFGTAHDSSATMGIPTAAQAQGGLRIEAAYARGTGSQSIWYIDFVDVYITYEQAALVSYTDASDLSDSVEVQKVGAFNQFITNSLGLSDSVSYTRSVAIKINDRIYGDDTAKAKAPIPADIFDLSVGPVPILHTGQAVSLHTVSGVTLAEFGPGDVIELLWTRELREVSTCQLTLPPLLTAAGGLPDIVPWLHWVSVFDTSTGGVLWTGPVQKVSSNHERAILAAKDAAALMARTRIPLTKRWENVDPTAPAAEMWRALIEQHNLKTPLVVRPDTEGGRYNYSAVADSATMDKAASELVALGLRWTVTAGTVVLGAAPPDPIAELDENDFLGDTLEVVRDGAAVYNDVLLRGPDSLARSRVDLYGLNLQTIVDVDSMYGVSNTDHATTQYSRYVSRIRDTVGQPVGAVLHPGVPLSLQQLIPSARFAVSAYGLRVKVELESLAVTVDANRMEVSVKLDSVTDLHDLPELQILSERKPGAASTQTAAQSTGSAP